MEEVNWKDYIISDPQIMFGKPTIKDTRIPVDLILEKLAQGENISQLLEAYPRISTKSIYACLLFAAERIKSEVVVPVA